mmetsp:Transcript_17758/g.36413  ORF Transcript_17758/g.36413 Transcript_17758/m.36413 type:complete len:543 (-) Transcript_17758:4588-6216(-)
MGVPKFFRWLSERYPLINQRVLDKNEFDCFYLDMNGIIHTCSQKLNEELEISNQELFQQIFSYTNHLFRIIRPRKLIYLAIDGVAPRAKMNQQRSRRFRSGKETEKNSLEKGFFDSNCITPGTDFMNELSLNFKKWLEKKMRGDKEWQQGCDIIFSGSEVPGEGEHKIMNFIRKLQRYDNYNERNLKHCLYGLDADLIMLGLVSHEKNFTLLREKLAWKGNQKNISQLKNLESLNNPAADEFHLLEISLLRDMLYLEFKPRDSLPFVYNLERIVDDFIFMCMLIGNDFLPSLPHLDIATGGLNLLVRSYKEIQPDLKGYLTLKSQMHMGRVEVFLEKLSSEAEALYFFQTERNNETFLTPKDYKSRYYEAKLFIRPSVDSGKKDLLELKKNYLHGLHWCLFYYHKGCPSWDWFYPQYYAPLASDLKNLKKLQIIFKKGRPFEPLMQLLAVLPPSSSEFLPKNFSRLMWDIDSPIYNFYPKDFRIDMNGKRNVWEGVVLLPFIDQKKLLEATEKKIFRENLCKKERIRNCFGMDVIFYCQKIY